MNTEYVQTSCNEKSHWLEPKHADRYRGCCGAVTRSKRDPIIHHIHAAAFCLRRQAEGVKCKCCTVVPQVASCLNVEKSDQLLSFNCFLIDYIIKIGKY